MVRDVIALGRDLQADSRVLRGEERDVTGGIDVHGEDQGRRGSAYDVQGRVRRREGDVCKAGEQEDILDIWCGMWRADKVAGKDLVARVCESTELHDLYAGDTGVVVREYVECLLKLPAFEDALAVRRRDGGEVERTRGGGWDVKVLLRYRWARVRTFNSKGEGEQSQQAGEHRCEVKMVRDTSTVVNEARIYE